MKNDDYQNNGKNESSLNQDMFNYLKKYIQGKVSGELIYLTKEEIDKYCITYSNLQKLSQSEKNRNIKTIVIDNPQYVIVFNGGVTAISMNDTDEYVYQSINNSSSLMKIRKEGSPSSENQITPTGVKFISCKTSDSEVVRKNLFTKNLFREVSVMEHNANKEDVLSILNGDAGTAKAEEMKKVDLGTKRNATVSTRRKSSRATKELYASIAESMKIKLIATSGELTIKGYVKKINTKKAVEGKDGNKKEVTQISDDFKNLIINKVTNDARIVIGKKDKVDVTEDLTAEQIIDMIERGAITARSVKDQLGLETDKIEMYMCQYAPYLKESKAAAIGAFIEVPEQFDKTYCNKSTIDMAALTEDIESGEIKKFISASDNKVINFFPLKVIVTLAKKIRGIEIEGTNKVIDYTKTIMRTKAEGLLVYIAKNYPTVIEAVCVKEGLASQIDNGAKSRIVQNIIDPSFQMKDHKEFKVSFIKSLLEQISMTFTSSDYNDELKDLIKACFRYSAVVVERGEDDTVSKKNKLIYDRHNFFPFKYSLTIDLEKVNDIKATIEAEKDSFVAFMNAIDASYKGAAKGQTKRDKFVSSYANAFKEGSLIPTCLEEGNVEGLRTQFLIQSFDGKWYGTPNTEVQSNVVVDMDGNPAPFPGNLRILKTEKKTNTDGKVTYNKTSLKTVPTLEKEDEQNNITLEAKMAELQSPFVSGYYEDIINRCNYFLDVEAVRTALELISLTQKNEKATKSKAQKYNDALDKLDAILGD